MFDPDEGEAKALAEVVPVRKLAERFGFTRTTIEHHRAHCLLRQAIHRTALQRAHERHPAARDSDEGEAEKAARSRVSDGE